MRTLFLLPLVLILSGCIPGLTVSSNNDEFQASITVFGGTLGARCINFEDLNCEASFTRGELETNLALDAALFEEKLEVIFRFNIADVSLTCESFPSAPRCAVGISGAIGQAAANVAEVGLECNAIVRQDGELFNAVECL